MYKEMLPTFHRYLFTWFSLISLAQQGVYDVVSSFGAMAARLIFSKVEEAAYFYFSQTVSRGRPKGKSVTNSVLSTYYGFFQDEQALICLDGNSARTIFRCKPSLQKVTQPQKQAH